MPGTPHYPKGIGDAFKELRQQIREGRTAGQSRVPFTTIKDGRITLIGDDQTIAKFGYLGQIAGEDIWGLEIWRADGTEALRIFSSVSGDNTYMALSDRSGNFIFSDDGISEQGIARPYLAVPFAPAGDPTTSTPSSNTSGTFTTVSEAWFPKQQPRMQIYYSQRTTSTTGQIQVVDRNGTVLAGPVSTALGASSGFSFGPFAVPGNFLDTTYIGVQTRVASGAGAVGLFVNGAYGIQS